VDLRQLFGGKIAFVYGPSGAGKTILISKAAFEFVQEGRRVLWVTFNEGRDTLQETWKSFGWNPEEVLVYDFPFVPQYRETLFNQVVDIAYKERAEVFIIDGVEAIVFDRASADALTKIGIYSVIGIESKYNPLGDIADVIIKSGDEVHRLCNLRRVKIQKARGVNVPRPVYYMAILSTGPVLLSNEHLPADTQVRPPGFLAYFIREIPLGTQIAVYGPYQRLSATVVDEADSVAYVHRLYQLGFFKRAKPRLVSHLEHLRLEHYALKTPSRYIITLDAEHIPRWFRRFRGNEAVWIDIYTTPPDAAGYDYVFYVDTERMRVVHSPEPLPQTELRFQ
jgi:RecA-superfamily ATPases implicated in signal transduction